MASTRDLGETLGWEGGGLEKVPPEDFWESACVVFSEVGFSEGAEPSSLSSSCTRFSPESAIVSTVRYLFRFLDSESNALRSSIGQRPRYVSPVQRSINRSGR